MQHLYLKTLFEMPFNNVMQHLTIEGIAALPKQKAR
jgi:hypothetical protein